MGIRTESIPVYPVNVFGTNSKSFWFGTIERILEMHPFLERPHKQLFYTLLFIEKANGVALIDNRGVRLDEPKVICVKPNSVFSLDINRMAKGAMICFTEDFFSLRYNNNVLYQFAFLKKDADDYIRFGPKQADKWKLFIRLMEEEAEAGSKGYEKVMRSYLNIFLFDLDRTFKPDRQSDKISGREEKVVLFEKLVDEYFLTHKTPSWYAAQLSISTNYLNKLCHGFRSSTSGELIRKRVIIEGQRLLHYTSLSVAEIAYKLGFETPSYFITFFKKSTNTTPESFRKNSF